MKTKEILELEKDNLNQINLIKEGMFWRAYNQSAFLFTKELKAYRPVKKYVKKVQEFIIYIGFPDKEISRFLNPEDNNSPKEISDKWIQLSGFSDLVQSEYLQWRKQISEKSPAILRNENSFDCYKILKKISAYSILENSPLESQNFLISLQKEINGLI